MKSEDYRNKKVIEAETMSKSDKKKVKRSLTEAEIEDILSFVKPSKSIPRKTAESVVEITKNNFRPQLQAVEIYPELIPQLAAEMSQIYGRSIIQAGENVGVLMAQSIGEKQTQSKLNTFHKAGSTAKTSGADRFSELLTVTKNQKNTSCFAYFRDHNGTIAELREAIGHSIVGLTLSTISTEIIVSCNKEDEPWYPAFKVLHDSDFAVYNDCITFKLDMDMLYEYKLTMQEIAERITDEYADIACVFSPSNIGQLDIFVDMVNIKLPENRVGFIDSHNAHEIYLDEVVKPHIDSMTVCGIEGITDLFYVEDEKTGTWMVETEGSNLEELLIHPLVDIERTHSNNIWEMYHIFGIEAVRKYLISEYADSMSSCNAKLLAERMTYDGNISSISRYTMRNDRSGPIGKASFEETMDNFCKAARHGEIESTSGVSASIICGKRAKMGTGLCDLVVDVEMLRSQQKEPQQVPNEVLEYGYEEDDYVEV
jgi:DNA-directed RNA polymerase beta' subunit